MPTQEQLRHHVEEFERQYPESLPDRIRWWAQVLDFDCVRLFQLLGLSGAEAARKSPSALSRVVDALEDRAEVVDDMLGQLLASFDYDLSALRTALHCPGCAVSGENRRSARRRGDGAELPYTPSPRARDGLLLNMIFGGGPLALRALQAYLSETRTGDGRREGRRG